MFVFLGVELDAGEYHFGDSCGVNQLIISQFEDTLVDKTDRNYFLPKDTRCNFSLVFETPRYMRAFTMDIWPDSTSGFELECAAFKDEDSSNSVHLNMTALEIDSRLLVKSTNAISDFVEKINCQLIAAQTVDVFIIEMTVFSDTTASYVQFPYHCKEKCSFF